MSKIINIRSLEEIGAAAQEFVQYISSSDLQSNIFAFFGQMGAGKTTFIKAICQELGVADAVNSPTFTIVNEYKAAKGFPVYHFDFYRINKITEAYDIGIDEYFSGDGLCLIEWPEKIQEILPDDCFQVFVYVDEEGNRTIEIDDNQPQLD
ncbi:MAG: tRNA (adenosine(37)-N6)-threonylcarbamoyltransferase complex ATPase subunit type 1 TsaE [Bacteroidales bacterium]|nr:tRNA (adenosine(37)-N6)-threonylcarbamoyltransferase complex ATPase subunit type 1 TsaE [Bacteroidales bacterium]